MITIGDYAVSSMSETFRIFPKNRHGDVIPITRINHFLTLRHKGGTQVEFKRFIHQKKWYWRDSREVKPVAEDQVVSEVARMLFRDDRQQAAGLLVKVLTGQPIG